jgi:hypothetical protein
MGPKTKNLITKLNELIQILALCGAAHWAKWFRKARESLNQSDFCGIQKVLDAYGGMGSFNDLVIEKYSIHKWGSPEVAEANQKISDLRDKIWDLTMQIKRESEIV